MARRKRSSNASRVETTTIVPSVVDVTTGVEVAASGIVIVVAARHRVATVPAEAPALAAKEAQGVTGMTGVVARVVSAIATVTVAAHRSANGWRFRRTCR